LSNYSRNEAAFSANYKPVLIFFYVEHMARTRTGKSYS